LQLFGDKIAARRLAVQIGVPVIEGTIGPTSLDEALAFFETLDGGAMMIKAVSGGGGRGMRAVRKSRNRRSLCALPFGSQGGVRR
jgi:pyruvate carboxylase